MPPVRPARYARAVRYVDVAQTSAAVAAARGRKAKVAALAALLGAAAPDERAIVARHLAGDCGHKLGVGYALVSELAAVAPADAATLTVGEVDARLAALAALCLTGLVVYAGAALALKATSLGDLKEQLRRSKTSAA